MSVFKRYFDYDIFHAEARVIIGVQVLLTYGVERFP